MKAATSRIVLSQTFKTLTKFTEKNAKIYNTKLILLDLSLNIFSKDTHFMLYILILFSIKLVKVKQV
jgi:hypothetical protein